VQVPFLDQLFYAGPLISSLGGADIFWIVGGSVWRRRYAPPSRPTADPVAS